MKIQTRFLIVSLALALAANTGSAQGTSGRTGTLSLQAYLLHGGPVTPVARVKFTLLDQALESLLQQAGFTGYRDTQPITTYALLLRRGVPETRRAAFDAVQKAIAEHTKATVTTDSAGNAEFTPVRVGTYYVMGFTETSGGVFVIWDTKVKILPGKNPKLVLNQDNVTAH